MFRGTLFRLCRRFQTRSLCNNNNKSITNNVSSNKEVENSVSLTSRHDAYKQLENLDFMTAAKMLFTDPPKKKQFGLDFHMVQFFFACLPSLAVYLVAQYARYEMRRMEAEAEVKKKAEEEAKAKELERIAEEEKQVTDPQISEVKARLDKLEETLKEIVVESKKQPGDAAERAASNAGKKESGTTKPGTPNAQEKTLPSGDGKSQAKASLPDQEQIKSEASSPDVNKRNQ